MANNIQLTFSFQLRKPYEEASVLIDVFNSILSHGGHADLGIDPITKTENVFVIKVYRCKNSYAGTSLKAKLLNALSKENYLNISKFNYAVSNGCRVNFRYSEPEAPANEKHAPIHGPNIIIEVFEHSDPGIQKSIAYQFNILDTAMSIPC